MSLVKSSVNNMRLVHSDVIHKFCHISTYWWLQLWPAIDKNAAGLSLCESDSCLPPRVFGFHDIDPWFAWPTENSMKIGSNYPHFTLWETYKKLLKMIIYSGFSHWKWWFSIVMLVYQRVSRKSTYSIIWFKYPRVGLNSWSNIWRTYRGHSSWLVTSPL